MIIATTKEPDLLERKKKKTEIENLWTHAPICTEKNNNVPLLIPCNPVLLIFILIF